MGPVAGIAPGLPQMSGRQAPDDEIEGDLTTKDWDVLQCEELPSGVACVSTMAVKLGNSLRRRLPALGGCGCGRTMGHLKIGADFARLIRITD